MGILEDLDGMLKEHGVEIVDGKIKRTCVICGKEFMTEDSSRVTCSAECRAKLIEREQRNKLRALALKAIPKLYLVKSDIKLQELGSKYIYGPVGVGKSVLMANYAIGHIKRGEIIKWYNATGLTIMLQSVYTTKENLFDTLQEIIKAPVLCIDDFLSEKMTEFMRQNWYYILNMRNENMAITYITSNKNLADVAQIDARIASRIRQLCEGIELTGKDKRLMPKKPGGELYEERKI